MSMTMTNTLAASFSETNLVPIPDSIGSSPTVWSRVETSVGRLVVGRLADAYARSSSQVPAFELVVGSGTTHAFGRGKPAFRATIRNARGLAALASLDELMLCEAFMAGAIDVAGSFRDVLALRELLTDRANAPMKGWHVVLRPLLFGQIRSDTDGIAAHYDEDPAFYLTFLGALRCYSHGIFEHPDEPLDVGIARKLDFALGAVGAKAGHRVLDIGAGWGAMTEFAGRRGVNVTSLTISPASENFCRSLIRDRGLPCAVVREHLLQHEVREPYDGIVNLGVSEHLPDYRASLERYATLVRKGGSVYLDFCATRQKHPFSAFMYKYIFNGNGTPVCLHEYLAEVARSPFEVVGLYNDRLSYAWTCRHWAKNLEAHEAEITRRWGRAWYRRFLVWLWGCDQVFSTDGYGAHRLVLRLRG